MVEMTRKDRDIGQWVVRPDRLSKERRKEVNKSAEKWARWIRKMLRENKIKELKKGEFDSDTG